MAEEPNQDVAEESTAPETSESTKPGKARFLKRLLTRKWLGILLVLSIIGHGIGLTCLLVQSYRYRATFSPEIDLGAFRVATRPLAGQQVNSARFHLHVALLKQVDQAARQRLNARKFRVQQDVEELLRQAHSGDFDDPLLGELKRQLQEQINHALGMRAIDEVIITDLTLQRNLQPNGGAAEGKVETAESVPWEENPSS